MSTFREEVIRRRVLLLEDQRHSIDDLRDVFNEKGYECEVALDLDTVWRILGERIMDLVVINARLPGVSDEELIEQLKAHDPEMSIIIYNGTGEKARQRRLRRMGADSYLSKASDLGAVARAVERVLQARS
ncbi:MAG: response regulator [Planctomycetota bacterium]|jgi:DNA-binding NtrC family response regulator